MRKRPQKKHDTNFEPPKTWIAPEEDEDTEYICPTEWCVKCQREVPFLVHKTRKSGYINGVRYLYKGKKANCRICGETIGLPEIVAYNLRKLLAESKKEKYKENENGE